MMDQGPKKILIVRFSSIGDIVLTTPVVRSLREAFPKAEIHFLTKEAYSDLLRFNPYLNKVHLLNNNQGLKSLVSDLKKENFDVMLDLHHNLRTLRLKAALGIPTYAFPKLNKEKFLLTRFKLDKLPRIHIVERYGKVLQALGCELDEKGLDFFCGEEAEKEAEALIKSQFGELKPIGIVLGGNKATKRWPIHFYAPLINRLGLPVILFGGPAEQADAQTIKSELEVNCLDAAGRFGLLTSAALLKHCRLSVANDTGFMHISAAFGLPTVSLWGNTVPAFGMYPYKTKHIIIEKPDLKCRPCSKIGYDKCPKGHFDCMQLLSPQDVYQAMEDGGFL